MSFAKLGPTLVKKKRIQFNSHILFDGDVNIIPHQMSRIFHRLSLFTLHSIQNRPCFFGIASFF